jgi:hypothetical protein
MSFHLLAKGWFCLWGEKNWFEIFGGGGWGMGEWGAGVEMMIFEF